MTVAKAERDLSFTVIRAPFNGVVGNKSVQVGDYVTPGNDLPPSPSTKSTSTPISRKRSSPGHGRRDGQCSGGCVDGAAPARLRHRLPFKVLLLPETRPAIHKIAARSGSHRDTAASNGKLRPGSSSSYRHAFLRKGQKQRAGAELRQACKESEP